VRRAARGPADLGEPAEQEQPQPADRDTEVQRHDAVAELVCEHGHAEQHGERGGE
jgi:hypothetical protein